MPQYTRLEQLVMPLGVTSRYKGPLDVRSRLPLNDTERLSAAGV